MRFSAEEFSLAGDKYLGRSYKDMDCQALVERMMADVGYKCDLGGSNFWYRECMKSGWTGTPEGCVKRFGSVPKGALLFILEAVSAKTPAKFRNDGIGDATHMGVKIGRGEGAIHSSHSRGCVCTSVFKDRTIPNGGWNRVGLLPKVFDYGKTIDRVMDHMGIGEATREETIQEESIMNVIIQAENGGSVKLRQSSNPKDSGYSIWEEYPSGTRAEVLRSGEEWSRIRIGSRSGWMMSRFLVADDGKIPAEPETAENASVEGTTHFVERQGIEKTALFFSVEELAMILPVLQSAAEQIVQKVGVG